MAMKNIFRKSAMDKLSSLEQLDKSLKVTTPLTWFALAGATFIIVVTLVWSIVGRLPSTVTAKGIVVNATSSTNTIYIEDVGTVQKIIGVNQPVLRGEPVLELQVDGVTRTYYSDQDGFITQQLFGVGDKTESEDGSSIVELLRVRPRVSQGQKHVVVCYVSSADKDKIKVPMEVHVTLDSADSSTYGHMEGQVINIDKQAVTVKGLAGVVGSNNNMAAMFTQNGAVWAVTCELRVDENSNNGYFWTNEKGREANVSSQATCVVKIITKEEPPITKLFGKLKDLWGAN